MDGMVIAIKCWTSCDQSGVTTIAADVGSAKVITGHTGTMMVMESVMVAESVTIVSHDTFMVKESLLILFMD